MAIDITYKSFPDYLDILVKGTRSQGKELDEMISIWQEIFTLSNIFGAPKILSRMNIKGRFPLNAQINMALKVEEMGCTKMHRVACLMYSHQLLREQELIVNFVRAQGYNGQLFDVENEALEWLLRSSVQGSSEKLLSI